MTEIFIKGNVPSLKNSKQISFIRGRPILTSSKTVKKYLKLFGIKSFNSRDKEVDFYKTITMNFPIEDLKKLFSKVNRNTHVKVGFHFIRGTRHKADFHNLVQILADLMVAFDVIEDDDMSHFIPFPLEVNSKYYSYDKINPGVIIKILK